MNVTFVNATLTPLSATSLSMREGRIAAIGMPPAATDRVVDLNFDRVLPGLINSHDHLQLNNFSRTKFRDRHNNVGEWIADLDARRASDRELAGSAAVPRDLRCRLGGIKNILAGTTTVAHHDPSYPVLQTRDFPCRVLAQYGWSHSLAIDGELAVRRSYQNTPSHVPWFIHAGEGVDSAAAGEFTRLEALDCIGSNTRLIHGVAFDPAERARLSARGAGLVWCPSSNQFLFGRTGEVDDLLAMGRVALGTDSRLSGADDLLAELRAARVACVAPDAALEAAVTHAAADLLGLQDRGVLREGALADLIVIPRDRALVALSRTDLRCVLLGGAFMCGDIDLGEQLASATLRRSFTLDGRQKYLHRNIADTLQQSDEAGRAA